MNITELSVKKPVAVIMMVIFVLSIGIYSYTQLGASLFPSVDIPVIAVTTTYTGAGVEEIENNIVKPIEDKVSGISGVDTISSTSQSGYTYTIVQFTMETDINKAFSDVQQALSDITNKIPKSADKPVIKKIDINAEPVITLSVSGSAPYEQLYTEADKMKQSIEKLKGVAAVTLTGDMKKQLLIKLDKTALEYYGLSVNTVAGKLSSDNTNPPVGQIKQETKTQTIRVLGEYRDIEEAKNVLIPLPNGTNIHLGEIAQITFEYPTPTQYVRFNNKQSIGIEVQKQSDSNVVATINSVKKEIEKFKKSAPKEIEINIANDDSSYINATLKQVKSSLIEGIITTSIVMLLFLRQVRASLVVLVAIPTSLIATFFMMYVCGFTLNMMSLLALSLCIGILVDDSIVVLENIQRHIKQGKNLIQAAIDGRNEIGMAAISITLCDVVVFGPIAFMSGMVGRFMRQFGLTIVFATLFSLLVSFTVTPMLASRLLTPENKEKKKSSKFDTFAENFSNKYRSFLVWCLNNRFKIISIVTIGLILSISLIPAKVITTEFMPSSDQSKFIVDVKLTPGIDVNQTDAKVKVLEGYIKDIPEVTTYFTTVGKSQSSSAEITVNLKPLSERTRGQSVIVKQVREFSKTLTGTDIVVSEASTVSGGGGSSKPVSLKIKGADYKVTKQISDQVENMIKTIPGVRDVSNSVTASQGEINLKIDRVAATQYGVSPSDVASALRVASNTGSKVGVYRQNGDEYDLVLEFQDNQIVTSNDIGEVKITNQSGQQVAINQVANIISADSPQQKSRENRQNLVTVSANIDGRTLGEVDADINAKLKNMTIPDGYEISAGGEQKNLGDTMSSMIKAIVLALLLVYTILVILYESFATPALRMLALPCAIIGSLLVLALTGNTLNFTSMMGFVMLDGLAAKNGTLLIDYTNTLMKKGMPLKDALVEAGLTRIKPIIMTSTTMVVGMIPSAIAVGEGSEMKVGMALVIIGGMVSSTLLSPILIPVVYTLIDDFKHIFTRRKKDNSLNIEQN